MHEQMRLVHLAPSPTHQSLQILSQPSAVFLQLFGHLISCHEGALPVRILGPEKHFPFPSSNLTKHFQCSPQEIAGALKPAFDIPPWSLPQRMGHSIFLYENLSTAYLSVHAFYISHQSTFAMEMSAEEGPEYRGSHQRLHRAQSTC